MFRIATISVTVEFDTFFFKNIVDCFEILTSGKPIFKEYQCHFTVPTKLTIPPSPNILYSALGNLHVHLV